MTFKLYLFILFSRKNAQCKDSWYHSRCNYISVIMNLFVCNLLFQNLFVFLLELCHFGIFVFNYRQLLYNMKGKENYDRAF